MVGRIYSSRSLEERYAEIADFQRKHMEYHVSFNLLLLSLIIFLKLNTFISLIVTSVVTAILLGMPLNKIMETIEAGMGSTLGHIALIFGLGAMLGKLLADGGGANRIADTLIAKFGPKHVQWAMLVAIYCRYRIILRSRFSLINSVSVYNC